MNTIKFLFSIYIVSSQVLCFANESINCSTENYPDISSARISFNLSYEEQSELLPDCSLLDDFQGVIYKIKNYTDHFEKISLSIFHKAKNASCGTGGRISIPNILISDDPQAELSEERSSEERLVWFVHEYGHSMLNQRLVKDLPVFRTFYDARESLHLMEDRLTEIYDRFASLSHEYQDAQIDNNVRLIESIKLEFEDLIVEEKTVKEKIKVGIVANNTNPNFIVLQSINDGYHEYFADLVAVLTFNSPTAFSDSMFMENASLEYVEKQLQRDFTHEHLVKGWHEDDSHGLLAPTRYFFWSNLWPTNRDDYSIKMVLEKVYNVILSEIERRLETESKQSPEEVNRNFIIALAKEFKIK
jgi:hypothetical protein